MWISKGSENYDEYLAELGNECFSNSTQTYIDHYFYINYLGISESARKVLVNLKTKLTIQKSNNIWNILTENDDGTRIQINFVSGVEFFECKQLHKQRFSLSKSKKFLILIINIH